MLVLFSKAKEEKMKRKQIKEARLKLLNPGESSVWFPSVILLRIFFKKMSFAKRLLLSVLQNHVQTLHPPERTSCSSCFAPYLVLIMNPIRCYRGRLLSWWWKNEKEIPPRRHSGHIWNPSLHLSSVCAEQWPLMAQVHFLTSLNFVFLCSCDKVFSSFRHVHDWATRLIVSWECHRFNYDWVELRGNQRCDWRGRAEHQREAISKTSQGHPYALFQSSFMVRSSLESRCLCNEPPPTVAKHHSWVMMAS